MLPKEAQCWPINGQRLSRERTPQELLVNQAGEEVQLTLEDAETKETRVISLKRSGVKCLLAIESGLRVIAGLLHAASQDRIGTFIFLT